MLFMLFSLGETSVVCRAEAVPNSGIKIGVAQNVASGQLLGKGVKLRDASGTTVSLPSGGAVTASGEYVRAASRQLRLPVRVIAGSNLGWDKTRYRGSLSFVQSGQNFTVVNELDLESYLRGILKIEMNPAWPKEALRAQAILARTFAVKNKGRFASKGYDLDATENSQIYRGVNAEDTRTDAAVRDTVGQVLTYNGQVASIFYHSDSGGSTADVSHVWGGSFPYLVARPETTASGSPYSDWQLTLTPAQVASAMSKLNVDVGSVRGMEVAQKDSYGRVVQLRVNGDRGSSEVRAHAFRMAVGSSVLRSTNFQIARSNETAASSIVQTPPQPKKPAPAAVESATFSPNADPLIEMTRSGVFTKEEIMDMLLNPDKRGEYLKKGMARISGSSSSAPVVVEPTPSPAEKREQLSFGGFTLVGKGWGHGVGLSQWGAKAMADRGASCEAILSHYFPGTKIGK